MTEIKITQLNLNHAKLAQDNINGKIAKLNIKDPPILYIFCIQEPYLFHKKHARKPVSCKSFMIADSPRTAIYTHQNLQNTWFIESLSNRDCTVIQTIINKKDTIIASVYLDITDQNVIPEWLHTLVKYTNDNRTGLLICMDSNCHSTTYGNETNKRGEMLEDFIATNLFKIENIGKNYTYETSQAKTIIDITISKSLNISVTDWTVDKTNNFSDHNTITFALNTEKLILPQSRQWEKADWKTFETELNGRSVKLREKITPQRMEKALDKFYTNINKSLDAACPLSEQRTVDKNSPW